MKLTLWAHEGVHNNEEADLPQFWQDAPAPVLEPPLICTKVMGAAKKYSQVALVLRQDGEVLSLEADEIAEPENWGDIEREVREALDVLDTDGAHTHGTDRKVSRIELRKVIFGGDDIRLQRLQQHLGLKFKDHKGGAIDEMFDAIDADNSGGISHEQLVLYVKMLGLHCADCQ